MTAEGAERAEKILAEVATDDSGYAAVAPAVGAGSVPSSVASVPTDDDDDALVYAASYTSPTLTLRFGHRLSFETGAGSSVPSVLLNRALLSESPICSIRLRPARAPSHSSRSVPSVRLKKSNEEATSAAAPVS